MINNVFKVTKKHTKTWVTLNVSKNYCTHTFETSQPKWKVNIGPQYLIMRNQHIRRKLIKYHPHYHMFWWSNDWDISNKKLNWRPKQVLGKIILEYFVIVADALVNEKKFISKEVDCPCIFNGRYSAPLSLLV